VARMSRAIRAASEVLRAHRTTAAQPQPGMSAWRQILRAVRAAEAVLSATDPHGLSAEARRLSGRQFGYSLSNTDAQTRLLALLLLATRAAKNAALADRRAAEQVWGAIGALHTPRAMLPRRPTVGQRRDRLPVEKARGVPIHRVFEGLGFTLRRRGRELVTRCPFHDDEHPSLRVNLERGVWYCDPCGIGGNVISFVQRLRHASFVDAVREVAAL